MTLSVPKTPNPYLLRRVIIISRYSGNFYYLPAHGHAPIKLVPPYGYLGANVGEMERAEVHLCDLRPGGTDYLGLSGGNACGAYDIIAEVEGCVVTRKKETRNKLGTKRNGVEKKRTGNMIEKEEAKERIPSRRVTSMAPPFHKPREELFNRPTHARPTSSPETFTDADGECREISHHEHYDQTAGVTELMYDHFAYERCGPGEWRDFYVNVTAADLGANLVFEVIDRAAPAANDPKSLVRAIKRVGP